MEFASRQNVVAIQAGRVHCVNNSHAIPDVAFMVNARTALACAHKDGTENIVLYVSKRFQNDKLLFCTSLHNFSYLFSF
jgi:hypothetical protein